MENRERIMNKRTGRKWLLILLLVLAGIVIYWQSREEISIYVNPDFKLGNYDSYCIIGKGDFSEEWLGAFLEKEYKMRNFKGVSAPQTLLITNEYKARLLYPPDFHKTIVPVSLFDKRTIEVKMHDAINKKLLFSISFRPGIFDPKFIGESVRQDDFKQALKEKVCK